MKCQFCCPSTSRNVKKMYCSCQNKTKATGGLPPIKDECVVSTRPTWTCIETQHHAWISGLLPGTLNWQHICLSPTHCKECMYLCMCMSIYHSEEMFSLKGNKGWILPTSKNVYPTSGYPAGLIANEYLLNFWLVFVKKKKKKCLLWIW